MLDKDYIDQMGKKSDCFTYNIKFKKHAFIYPLFRKKNGAGERKVSDPIQGIIIFFCTVSCIRNVLINKRVSPQVIKWKKRVETKNKGLSD